MNAALGPDKIGEQYNKNSEVSLLAFQQIINGRIVKANPNKNTILVPSVWFKQDMISDGLIDEVCQFYKSAGWASVYWENGFTLRREVEVSE